MKDEIEVRVDSLKTDFSLFLTSVTDEFNAELDKFQNGYLEYVME